MRVRWCGRGSNVGKRSARGHVGVEDQFLDSHNLLAVAIFLQLAQQWLNLIDESLFFVTLELSEDFFCHGS